jgi:oxepin-CoA hydrolase/3-oxo-5,6-dehydrosuberyl-CoA semialdehyde dehydrogenase
MNEDIIFLKDEFPKLLDQIHPDLEAQWGVMGPQHMVEHLSMVMMISNGRAQASPFYEEEKLQKNYIRIIENKNLLKRNTKAPILPTEAPPLHFKSMEEAKGKLLKNMALFFDHFDENPEIKYMHPAFGMLNFEEWAYFHAIHSKYHLEQFGLYEGGTML